VVTPQRARARWMALAFLAGLLVGAPAPGAGVPPPCAAEASFEVDRATVGQQVVYRVLILSREDATAVDWIEPPRFPGFRAEWLPGRPSPEPVLRDGVRYRAREERRALFPERPGELRAKPAGLRCRVATDAGERGFLSPVPAVALRAVAPPEEGRPAGFAGLIGPIALQTIVTPRQVNLGKSVRAAVMLRGNGNLWDATDPLAGVDDAEIFRRRPELTLETGARLAIKRHFAYDIVPLREGVLEIPAIRVAYFDPATGQFAVVSTEAVHVAVAPRESAAARGEEGPRRFGGVPDTPPTQYAPSTAATNGARALRRWWPAAAVLVAGAAGLLALRRRSRASRARAEFDAALAAARDGDGEAAALARALRAAITRRVSAAPSLTAEELAALPALPTPVAEATRLLAEVERARFDPSAPLPSRDAVWGAVAML
jgi:hypothetical protein